MEKLELKHLSPYLGYVLKCEILNYKCDYVGNKYGILNGLYQSGGLQYYTFGSRDIAGKTSDLIKPILRPLSDIQDKNTIAFYKLDSIDLELIDIQEWTEELIHMLKSKDKFQPEQFEYLFSQHFDVFGLIESGLAIDINTLKQ